MDLFRALVICEDRGTCTGNCDSAHMGVMCVLVDMQDYPTVLIRKVSRRVTSQSG